MIEKNVSSNSVNRGNRLISSMSVANSTPESEYDGRPICELHNVEMDLGSFSPDGSGCDWLCWSCIHDDYSDER